MHDAPGIGVVRAVPIGVVVVAELVVGLSCWLEIIYPPTGTKNPTLMCGMSPFHSIKWRTVLKSQRLVRQVY